MGFFDSLRDHYSLETPSDVKSDLRFEISDPNYLLIHVHIAYIWCGPLLAASEATAASKWPRRSNLTSDSNSLTSITFAGMVT